MEGIKQWKNTGAELQYIAAIYQEMIRRRATIEWSCFHQIYDSMFGVFYLERQKGRMETTPSHQLFRPTSCSVCWGRRVIRVPGHSVMLVGGAGALESKGGAAAAANLFPPTPHLTLWYEPHAATQPRFDPACVYALDTKQFQGKEFAVVSMNLASLGLEKGASLTLDMAAASSAGGGLVRPTLSLRAR